MASPAQRASRPSPIAPGSPEVGAGPLDRQERRKLNTRARLLDAARTLFVSRGYHATRPQDIAREADVASGTFYTYFADKRAAFIAFTEQTGDELMARMAGAVRPGDDFESALARALAALLEYSAERPGVLAVAFGASVIASGTDDARDDRPAEAASTPPLAPAPSLRDRLANVLAAQLRAGMDSGALHADYEPALIANAMVGLVHQALVHAGGRDPARVIADVTRFCRRALVREPGDPSPQTRQDTRP